MQGRNEAGRLSFSVSTGQLWAVRHHRRRSRFSPRLARALPESPTCDRGRSSQRIGATVARNLSVSLWALRSVIQSPSVFSRA
jgi:hypothetical protein